jgi:hypothetical protein
MRIGRGELSLQNVAVREAEVSAALQALVRSKADHPGSRIMPELSLCQSEARIDLAVANSRLLGWEIKTAADTLDRLPGQQEVYSRIFDRLWLVADTRHIDRGLGLIPDWWGVMTITQRGGQCHLNEVRRSRINPGVHLGSLVRLLWREEVLQELESLNLAEGLNRSPRRELWHALAAAAPRHISAPRLRDRVRIRLKERQGWRSVEQQTSSGDS